MNEVKIELKPCPFCGAPAIMMISDYGRGNYWYQVRCSNVSCNVKPSGPWRTNEVLAADKWNARADDE